VLAGRHPALLVSCRPGVAQTMAGMLATEDSSAQKSAQNRSRIPTAMRPVAGAITAITDSLCDAKLDDEYGALCRDLVGRLARKRPSPLVRGRPEIWAAGVIYASVHRLPLPAS
jgi:hypothetical protein